MTNSIFSSLVFCLAFVSNTHPSRAETEWHGKQSRCRALSNPVAYSENIRLHDVTLSSLVPGIEASISKSTGTHHE